MSGTITKREAATLLQNLRHKLNERDQTFADSLLSYLASRGDLSPNQWHWVTTLVKRAQGVDRPSAEVIDLGNFGGVNKLFDTAAKKLKRMKLRLQLPDGEPVILYRSGPESKYPGHIQVTNGIRYGETGAVWYGRIAPEGKWTVSPKVDTATSTSLVALLSRLARKPQEVAVEYGRKTGNCCFCGKTLTDGRSVKAGYGPICADKWGLAWGE